MRIPVVLKAKLFRRSNRIPDDRGNIGLTVMVGTVLMMLATFAAVKALAPALHTVSARSDIRRAGTLSNLANSYIAQTGDMQPTIAKLVTAGLLPSGAKGVCATCGGVGTYTTNDGSVLSMVPGGSAGIFGMTLVPGPNMAQDMNYYLSHLTGSIQNGSTVAWNQPVPALANLGTRFVQTDPANPGATQSVNSPLSTNGNWALSGAVGTGYISSGTINTNGNPVYSGSENTGAVNAGTINTSTVNASGTVNSGGVSTGTVTGSGDANFSGNANISGNVMATGDTALAHGIIWQWWQPISWIPPGWWPAPEYWWYNYPGYSGCGGNNPSAGVNTVYNGSFQVWQGGSCSNWWRVVPGGPNGW